MSPQGTIDGYISTKNTKWDTGYYYKDGSLWYATMKQGNNTYWYDKKGLLNSLTMSGKDDKVLKEIDYVSGTDKPMKVTYGAHSYESSEAQKIEIFDGKDYPVKEIYVKDGEKVVIFRTN